MTSDKASLEERHDWRCDCEWCWLGVSYTPQPPSRWHSVKSWFRTHATDQEKR